MKYILTLLTLLTSLTCYSQVTTLEIDTSKTEVNIYNYGTLIEKNEGNVIVNNGTNSSSDKVELDEESTKAFYEALDHCEQRLSEIQEYEWVLWLGLILCVLPILTAIPAIVDESKFWAILSVSLFSSGIIIVMIHVCIIN